MASAHPEIKKTINCIVTLVKKNITLVSENEAYVLDRHQRIKHELDDLRTSDKIMQYLNDSVTTAQFVDGKQ
ncbi:MAG: hypothetical protein SGI97_03070 [candidate division Zixibacteria bacterium]|nr:hypothetical protein [candidate division Zixibacteria bacterium]